MKYTASHNESKGQMRRKEWVSVAGYRPKLKSLRPSPSDQDAIPAVIVSLTANECVQRRKRQAKQRAAICYKPWLGSDNFV